MQIVIDIDENVFTRLFANGTEDYAIVNDDLFAIVKAIRKGTLLPKEHGELINRSKVIKSLFDYYNGKKTIGQCIDDVPTIIKADKENRDEGQRINNKSVRFANGCGH